METPSKLYLTKRSNGVYYVGYLDNGRRRWQSSHCTVKSDAVAYLKNFQTLKDKPKHRDILLSELSVKVKELHSSTVRPSTISSYIFSLSNIQSALGNKLLSQYTAEDFDKFKSAKLGELSRASVNLILRSVKACFNLAVKWDFLMENPLRKVKLIRIPQRAPLYLTQEEFRTLVKAVKEQVLRDLFLFASLSGLRISEMLNLTWDCIDFDKKQVLVKNSDDFLTKSGRERVVPLNAELLTMIKNRRKKFGSSRVVFSKRNGYRYDKGYISRRFKSYVRKVGLNPAYHLHSLRHSFGSWCAQKNVPIYTIQALMGHSNVQTTSIYAHLSESTLHEAVNRL